MPYWPHVHSSISSVHQFFIQLTDAGFANPAVHVFASAPVAYCVHLGWLGVSQYMSVHASGLPSLTEQLLQPSKYATQFVKSMPVVV